MDMRLLYHTTYEMISGAVAIRGIGVVVGSIAAGVYIDAFPWRKMHCGLWALVVSAICIAAMPWLGYPQLLWCLYLLLGAINGTSQVAGQAVILEIWDLKASPHILLCNLMGTIGCMLAPVISNPFLSTGEPPENVLAPLPTKSIRMMALTNNHTTTLMPEPPPSTPAFINTRVQYAFLAIGIITFVMCIPFALFLFFEKRLTANQFEEIKDPSSPSKAKSIKDMVNPATYANGSMMLGIAVLSLMTMFIFFDLGLVFIIITFIRTYFVTAYNYSRDNASLLLTSVWIGMAVGYLPSVVATIFISVGKVFFIYTLLLLASVITWYSCASWSVVCLWLGIIMTSAVTLPLYNVCIVYANTLIRIEGVALSMAVVARGLGDMVFVWLCGSLYDSRGPVMIPRLILVLAVTSSVVSLLFLTLGTRYGARKV